MRDTFVLDACALIAFLNKEPGMDVVREILLRALEDEVSITMNKLNLLEVYYDVYRRCGEGAATDMLEMVAGTPIDIIHEISDAVFKEAGRLKASYRISLADSMALAEASISGSSLLTSDHHEFDIIEKSESIKFHWIR
jgi:PIN domain nuclease of toxin-antitoxin system